MEDLDAELLPAVPDAPPGNIVHAGEIERANRYLKRAKSDATHGAYAQDWARWTEWCAETGRDPGVPADPFAVVAYVTALADAGSPPSTILRRLSGLGYEHRRRGHDSPARHPAVSEVMSGIRNVAADGGHRTRQAAPLDTATVRLLVEDMPTGLAGARDRAMLLLGYGLGLRSREIVRLSVRDITDIGAGGVEVFIAQSKTDQGGAGVTLALPRSPRESTCPARAVLAWIEAAQLTDGPLFRNIDRHGNLVPPGLDSRGRHRGDRMARESVGRIIHRACLNAGILSGGFSAHSLRRGFATTAYRIGKDEKEISRTGRWRHLPTQRRYDASSRWEKPAGGLDL